MKEDDFNNLVKSIKQAGKIKNGQLKPGRTFEFNPMDIKAIRNKLHKSQSEWSALVCPLCKIGNKGDESPMARQERY